MDQQAEIAKVAAGLREWYGPDFPQEEIDALAARVVRERPQQPAEQQQPADQTP